MQKDIKLYAINNKNVMEYIEEYSFFIRDSFSNICTYNIFFPCARTLVKTCMLIFNYFFRDSNHHSETVHTNTVN